MSHIYRSSRLFLKLNSYKRIGYCSSLPVTALAGYNPKRFIQEFPDLKLDNALPRDHLLILPELLNETPETNEILRLPKIGEGEINYSKITIESAYKGLSQSICLFENFVTDINNDSETTQYMQESFSNFLYELEKHLYPMDTIYNILSALISVDTDKYNYKEIHDVLLRCNEVRNLRLHGKFKEMLRSFAYNKDVVNNLRDDERKLMQVYHERMINKPALDKTNEKTYTEFKRHLSTDLTRFSYNILSANRLFSHTVDDPDLLAQVSGEFEQNQDLHHRERTPLKINIDTYDKFMKVCPDRFIRQNLWRVKNKRCSPKALPRLNNIALINNIRVLRRKVADLAGFRSHVEFRLSNAMAKSKQEILDNLNQLNEANSTILRERLEELNEYAADNSSGDSSAISLQEYDIDYWMHKYKYDIIISQSENDIRNYFPLNKVMSGLAIYFKNYFDIEFKPNNVTEKLLWTNDGLKAFDVFKTKDQPIGTVIYDPYQRANKVYKKPFYSRLRGKKQDSGVLPSRLVSTPFVIDRKTGEAQLSIEDVANLFYIFATVVQRLLYDYNYYELNVYGGLEVDVDDMFPRLCLLHLFNDHRILQSCSDRGGSKSIDVETARRINKSMTYFEPLSTWQELYKARLDLEAHSATSDIKNLVAEIYPQYSPFERDQDNYDYCAMHEIFFGPKDGVQYSRLWSKQLADFCFSKTHDQGALSNGDTDMSATKKFNLQLLEQLFEPNNLNTKDKLTSLVGRSFKPSEPILSVL